MWCKSIGLGTANGPPKNLLPKGKTGNIDRCREFQERNGGAWKRARGLESEIGSVEPWTEEETDFVYTKLVEWCAEIAEKSVSGDGDEARRRVWDESGVFGEERVHRDCGYSACRRRACVPARLFVTIGVLTTGPRLQNACNDTFLQPNYYTYSNSDHGCVLDVTRPR
jgi:hypothetical protein